MYSKFDTNKLTCVCTFNGNLVALFSATHPNSMCSMSVRATPFNTTAQQKTQKHNALNMYFFNCAARKAFVNIFPISIASPSAKKKIAI